MCTREYERKRERDRGVKRHRKEERETKREKEGGEKRRLRTANTYKHTRKMDIKRLPRSVRVYTHLGRINLGLSRNPDEIRKKSGEPSYMSYVHIYVCVRARAHERVCLTENDSLI